MTKRQAVEEFEKKIKVKSYDGYKAWYYYPPDGKYYGSNFLVAGWGYWVEFDLSAKSKSVGVGTPIPINPEPPERWSWPWEND